MLWSFQIILLCDMNCTPEWKNEKKFKRNWCVSMAVFADNARPKRVTSQVELEAISFACTLNVHAIASYAFCVLWQHNAGFFFWWINKLVFWFRVRIFGKMDLGVIIPYVSHAIAQPKHFGQSICQLSLRFTAIWVMRAGKMQAGVSGWQFIIHHCSEGFSNSKMGRHLPSKYLNKSFQRMFLRWAFV